MPLVYAKASNAYNKGGYSILCMKSRLQIADIMTDYVVFLNESGSTQVAEESDEAGWGGQPGMRVSTRLDDDFDAEVLTMEDMQVPSRNDARTRAATRT